MDIRDIKALDLELAIKHVRSSKTIGEGKAKAREFRDKYNLNDRQTTDLLFRNAPISRVTQKTEG